MADNSKAKLQNKVLIGLLFGIIAFWFIMRPPSIDMAVAQEAAKKNAEKMHAMQQVPQAAPPTPAATPAAQATPLAAVEVKDPVPAYVKKPATTEDANREAFLNAVDTPPVEHSKADDRGTASVSFPAPAPSFAIVPVHHPDVERPGCKEVYTVTEKEETVAQIAYRYGHESAWPNLAKANKLAIDQPSSLKRGETLCIDFSEAN